VKVFNRGDIRVAKKSPPNFRTHVLGVHPLLINSWVKLSKFKNRDYWKLKLKINFKKNKLAASNPRFKSQGI
jgi:hypothetical protein